MRGPGRIANGLLTDPERPVGFRFDGCPMQGLEGDTLASALLANGKRLVARSFKYHRPRGPVHLSM
jgi:sarcosine oxidase subunit alpha